MRLQSLIGLLLLAACADDGAVLQASNIVMTPAVPGANVAAAYLKLSNSGQQAIRITRISSPQFERVRLHETVLDDGVSRMRAVPELVIPSNDSVTLSPGGKHLMLMQALDAAAARQDLTLHFYDGDILLLSVSSRVSDQ